VQQLLHIKL